MKFKKEWLQGLVYRDHGEAEIIDDNIISTSRWSIHYVLIFKYENRFYRTSYNKGSTEYQDEEPFENDKDEIECIEVIPIQKTITVYEPKNKGD